MSKPSSAPGARRARIGIGSFDQLTSSVSNIVIVFAMAGVASVETFGQISLVFAALATSLALSRGALGTLIHMMSHDPAHVRRETSLAGGLAICGGFLGALAIVGASARSTIALPALFLALSLPFVLAQDVGRYCAIALGRPLTALASDGLWATGGIALLWWTWSNDDATLTQISATWSLLAVAATGVLYASLRLAPAFRGMPEWLGDSKADRLRFGGEALMGAGASFIVLLAAAALVSSAAVAALRGAGTVMGPLSLTMTAVTLAVVPELRRTGPSVSAVRAWRHLRKVAIALSALAVIAGVVAWLLPAAWGARLLGDTWSVVREIIPLTAVEYVALAWLAASAAGLRAQGRSGSLLRLRAVFTALTLGLACSGALLAGSVWGMSLGLAIAAIVGAILGRHVLLRGAN